MTVAKLIENENFKPILLCDETREIVGAYCGDLLSWVMGKAQEDNAFVTIMSNVNVLAVASLVNVSCVIFCEGVTLDAQVIEAAKSKEINLISTSLSSFSACATLSSLI